MVELDLENPDPSPSRPAPVNPDRITPQTPPRAHSRLQNFKRSKSLQVFRHWVDPTVDQGIFNRCLNLTCQLRFAGYFMAAFISLTLLVFCIAMLLLAYLGDFDIPTTPAWAILGSLLTLWAKPVNNRKKKDQHPDAEEEEEEEGPVNRFLDRLPD